MSCSLFYIPTENWSKQTGYKNHVVKRVKYMSSTFLHHFSCMTFQFEFSNKFFTVCHKAFTSTYATLLFTRRGCHRPLCWKFSDRIRFLFFIHSCNQTMTSFRLERNPIFLMKFSMSALLSSKINRGKKIKRGNLVRCGNTGKKPFQRQSCGDCDIYFLQQFF